MTVLRISFVLRQKGKILSLITNKYHNSHSNNKLITTVANFEVIKRPLSTFEITKNIEIISSDKKKNVTVSNLTLSPSQDKPMVLFLSWLLAKRKHIYKYANLYVEQGFDVMNINCTPWQLLWPVKGSQLVAADVVAFLERNPSYQPLFIHGFSVGGYLWGEVMVKLAQDQTRYRPIIDRIAGQVWDSVADITEITVGVPIAVFPRNSVMQSALRKYMIYHLKAFHKVATIHYLRASQMFHTNLIKAPALFYLSETDPVGAVSSNARARESWESMGMEVYWKCWEKSPHVGHLQHHPKEYIGQLYEFLDKLDLVPYPEKIEAKL